MSSAPLVSIVVNNYNYARYVGEAIESALAQSYPAVEVIVVDDGSTDESREVIARYGDRVRPVLKANGGQASAYNAGLAHARGEAVCFLDSDDTLYPSAIEHAVAAMDGRTSKVQLPLTVTDAQGRSTGEVTTRQKPPDGDLRRRIAADGPLYDFEFHTGSVYSRWFLDLVCPVPEPPYRNGADVYLITLAPVYGLLRTAQEPLGTYRAHGANNYRGKQLDDARIANYLARFETNAAVLAHALCVLGIDADPAAWRTRNFNYLWLDRLKRAKHDLQRAVPAGGTIVLIDGAEWGAGDHVPGRRLRHFRERDGEYFGLPADDAAALEEIVTMRSEGAAFVAVWWTSSWVLQHFPALADYLTRTARCVRREDWGALYSFEQTPKRPGRAA